jgi:protein-S-isoprenylcysteine O-methyltransferase Ste14
MPKDWPALLIGLIVAAYWGRVVRLVIKTRRKTGKAGNFFPPEPLGRVLRVIWYPTVLAWIAHPFFTAWRAGELPWFLRNLHNVTALQWAGVGLAAAAFGLTLICWKRMGRSWRMGIDPNEKTQLIFTGPYAYVRHPIYALSSVMMLGSAVAVSSPLMLILAAVHLLFLQWEAHREEQYLLRIHGEVYGRYLSSVGRMIPRSLRPADRTGPLP